ncbi:cobalt ECF transporter T component CbiQ [uncultured Methanobrevibacter sp.]|uniref:cobalt ECF transporter T component CbiQ n=1 Tax=uncultured Methanobrevibacter sp. TaxID=253161 RepID=UPI00258D4D1F|nr:cobalt ECF transporter T component CbiQ [uncultured Methanobrevibacter sp.]
MADITQTLKLDDIASGDSIIHNLNGPVKLISTIIIIVFTVFSQQIIVPIIMEIFLLLILYLSKVSIKDAFKRIALLLPFGGAIIIFQPFIHPGNVLWAYSWIQITDAGLNWAILLFGRLITSLTAIVILSSTSPMQEIVASFRKLKMPKELAMILSITVRFLFVFIDELTTIRNAQKSRNFNIHSKLVPYRWIVRQVGYTIAMMFLKSYEQGERVHKSMISRGFSDTSQLFNEKTQLEKSDYIYLISIITIMIVIEVILYKYTNHLGYLGMKLTIN